MKIIAMIPARYAATRFPFKLMQPLGNKTVIRHTYDNTVATQLFDEVYVVTDHDIIFNEIQSHGGKAIMSQRTHESGSDRIAEAITDLAIDVVINVQGDEPFVNKQLLQTMVQLFKEDVAMAIKVATPYKPITDAAQVHNPNIVKVVVDHHENALMFSRAAIPFHRDQTIAVTYKEHIGVYGFRKEVLLQFTQWPMGILESIEKLEQLRYLENGVPIKMIATNDAGVKIDVPEDLPIAEAYLNQMK
ncbi:3-deoxy-manno-octulosonate cytidylyltransferase [Ferruginibacter yonginensis]|uniref:3-deoxy-manno-octulosonate cytidylyltransferase n=1 Tax=Ferruginibacter yonginensis TaxID=1310416 RepID=A0ABV8QTX4_9BACT